MKNIINEKTQEELHGRMLFTSHFVSVEDIKDKSVLDIGCGYGWFLKLCKNSGASGITGIEVSREDLETAKKSLDNEQISLLEGSALNIPAQNDLFDTVTAWEVLEHPPINQENKMFSEVRRVLKTNGVFYLSTPYDNVLSKILDPAWWVAGHRHYSKKSMECYAKSAGFSVEKVTTRGKLFELFYIIDLYISKWIFRKSTLFFNEFKQCLDKEYDSNGYAIIFYKLRKM